MSDLYNKWLNDKLTRDDALELWRIGCAEIASLRAQLAERDPAQCAICQSYHHVGPHSIQWSATESSEAHPPNAEGKQ